MSLQGLKATGQLTGSEKAGVRDLTEGDMTC